jgi:hypothetical protein
LLGGFPEAQQLKATKGIHWIRPGLTGDDANAGLCPDHPIASGKIVGLHGCAELLIGTIKGDDRIGVG